MKSGPLQTIILSIFVIGALITGFYTFLGDMAGDEGYAVDVENDSAYMAVYDKTNQLNTKLNKSYTALTTMRTSTTVQFFTGLVEIVKITKTIIAAPFTMLLGSNGVINTLAGGSDDSGMGLPTWVVGLMFGVIVVILIFAFMAIVIKWRG